MPWLVLALLACRGEPGPEDIRSGEYQFWTLAVQDGCLDGALEALFMPEGRDARHPFEYLIYVPSVDETPIDYSVDFREPFVGMPVTVEGTPEGLSVRGSVMDAVLLDENQYGDCVATMSVDVDLWPTEEDLLDGEARIDVSEPRGSENRCPVLEEDPCEVVLDLEAGWEADGSPESDR